MRLLGDLEVLLQLLLLASRNLAIMMMVRREVGRPWMILLMAGLGCLGPVLIRPSQRFCRMLNLLAAK
jgi:UPF0716 family protein affecting phage T7 exclusion